MLISIQVSKIILILFFKKLFYLFYTTILQLTLHPVSYFSFHNQYYSFIYSLSLLLAIILAISLQTKHRNHGTQIYKPKPTTLTIEIPKWSNHHPTKH